MRVLRRAVPLALTLVALVSSGAAAQSSQRIAYVRGSVLLDQAPGRAEAEAQFQKETAPLGEQIKRMSDSLDAMVAAYQKVQATMTPTARDARQKELQAKNAEYQRRTADLRQKADQRQGELVQPILDKVKSALEEARVEGGYAFILNSDEGSSIVAMDKNLDLTDKVLAKLRASGGTATRPASTAPATTPSGVVRPQTPPND
jgi:outer membrane protein